MIRIKRLHIGGRDCVFYLPEGEGPYPAVLLSAGNADELAPSLLADRDSAAVYYTVSCSWSHDLTPWPAEGLKNREPFTGGASEYLAFLREEVRPVLLSSFPVEWDAAHHAAAGYSLGGLFSLWTLLSSDLFGAAASLSGSLWYDGWTAFAGAHLPAPGMRVYLSLGRSEERAGDPRMAAVGDNTRSTFALFAKTLPEDRLTLEWNRGGHFTGIPNRWQKAMRWLVPRIS